MACPLSRVLNNEDRSPRKPFKEDRDDGDYKSASFCSTKRAHINRPPVESIARRFSPVILDAETGSLYKCRASKPTNTLPVLLMPPQRSVSDDYDVDPPSHEMDFMEFNIFKALLQYPDLIVELVKYLHVDDFVALYAISKDFHRLVNSRFTTMILAQSTTQAPESSQTFIFRCYKSLCIKDPGARPNESIPDEVRYVPSLRWLRMINFRERVVDEIVICLSNEGHFLPESASLTLKKIWFTIDIGDNARRVGVMHNTKFWTDKDIYVATMFFIKLDMRLTDPVTGTGELGMRKMLLGQRSLSTLLRVLKREEMLTQIDVLKMMVLWNYRPAPHLAHLSIMDVPPHQIGKLQYEGWGNSGSRVLMMQIDELVMRESVRRSLDLHKKYVDMILFGYVDPETFEDRWHTEINLQQEEEEEEEEDRDDKQDEDEGEHEDNNQDGEESEDDHEDEDNNDDDALEGDE